MKFAEKLYSKDFISTIRLISKYSMNLYLIYNFYVKNVIRDYMREETSKKKKGITALKSVVIVNFLKSYLLEEKENVFYFVHNI